MSEWRGFSRGLKTCHWHVLLTPFRIPPKPAPSLPEFVGGDSPTAAKQSTGLFRVSAFRIPPHKYRYQKEEGHLTMSFFFLVGVAGFEPTASWTRTKRDTKLRHTPKTVCIIGGFGASVKYQNHIFQWHQSAGASGCRISAATAETSYATRRSLPFSSSFTYSRLCSRPSTVSAVPTSKPEISCAVVPQKMQGR